MQNTELVNRGVAVVLNMLGNAAPEWSNVIVPLGLVTSVCGAYAMYAIQDEIDTKLSSVPPTPSAEGDDVTTVHSVLTEK